MNVPCTVLCPDPRETSMAPQSTKYDTYCPASGLNQLLVNHCYSLNYGACRVPRPLPSPRRPSPLRPTWEAPRRPRRLVRKPSQSPSKPHPRERRVPRCMLASGSPWPGRQATGGVRRHCRRLRAGRYLFGRELSTANHKSSFVIL